MYVLIKRFTVRDLTVSRYANGGAPGVLVEEVAAAAVQTAEELGKKELSGEAYAEIRKY